MSPHLSPHPKDLIIRQVCNDVVADALLDYVGFWEVVAAVSNHDLEATVDEHVELTLAVSRCMIERGLRVFQFEGGKPPPVYWQNPTTDDLVNRIRDDWSRLDGKPVVLGQVCWFAAPAA